MRGACWRPTTAASCSGQRLLPGHYGAASHALQHAADLRQALDVLADQRALLSPLLSPRLLLDEQYLYLYWLDSCGIGAQRRFLLEASCTALVAMSRWLAGQALPWQCSFSHAQPRYVEQYWVHLGETVRFDAPLDLMRLPREYLHQPWPGAALTAGRAAQQQGLAQLDAPGFRAGLLDRLYSYLLAHIREPLQLEGVALALGMSASTLKRKLQKHDTHFREQLTRRASTSPCTCTRARLWQRGSGRLPAVQRHYQFPPLVQALDRPGAEPGAADVRAVARRRSATRGRIRDGSPQA